MRVGVDAMGGDHAPEEVVKGVLAARDLLAEGDQIVLVGSAKAIEPHLAGSDDWQEFVAIEDCADVVGMNETPVEALRSKPDNSISRMVLMHKSGELQAVISAGNTGACVAACQMHLRRLPGAHRPGIAVTMPTFHGPVTICDVGANVNCRPTNLVQYGVMASIYAERVAGVKSPGVGLLSIGAEDAKGNTLVKNTRELFRQQEGIRYIGNVEGRDLFRGTCDVVVCEGFVGNVCLKLTEGLAEGLLKSMGAEIRSISGEAGQRGGAVLKQILAHYDYNEYGGAPLLGVNGICIICHGSSNERAIYNAIRASIDFAAQGVNERITALLSPYAGKAK